MPRQHRPKLLIELLEDRDQPAAAFQSLPVFTTDDPAVLDNARTIALHGQELGRRADAFMKVGDSNTSTGGYATPMYLNPLGAAGYNPVLSGLSNYGAGMAQTLAAFQSPVAGGNSFTRYSSAAYPGWTLPIALPHVPEELAATNAGIALVMIGTNDLAVYNDVGAYRAQLEALVTTLTAAGVVPVLSTLPEHVDNAAYAPRVVAYNQAIADVGDQYKVPVWNLWRTLSSLPNLGLRTDGVHLNVSPNGGGSFTPVDMQFGQNVRNLQALQLLDWFRRQVEGPSAAPPPLAAWTPLPAGQTVYAVGSGEGQGPSVSVYDRATGQELDRFLAYEPTFGGGVRVAVADVNGDGYLDVVTGAGFGGGPVVKVFSGADGSVLASFFAFEGTFRGGVGSVDAADLDGDGRAEVVVGAGNGGAPVVAVFHGGDLAEVQRFFAFDPSFRGGVNVAAGAFAGVGPGIAAGAGLGGGPQVSLFAYGSASLVTSFFAFDPSYRGGIVLAAGDRDGDGEDDLVVGTAAQSTRVRVVDPITGAEKLSVFAGPTTSPAGVRVAVVGGGLLVGNGPGGALSVLGYAGLTGDAVRLQPDNATRGYGIYVG